MARGKALNYRPTWKGHLLRSKKQENRQTTSKWEGTAKAGDRQGAHGARGPEEPFGDHERWRENAETVIRTPSRFQY